MSQGFSSKITQKKHFAYLTEVRPDDFIDIALATGGKPFHGKVLRKWFYRNRAKTFQEMTDISLSMRKKLEESYALFQLREAALQKSEDGTVKFAFALIDGQIIETVIIPARNRATLCLSSQVGCPLGCLFCASGLKGFVRNLTQGEMVEQFLIASAHSSFPVSNVVFMGTGEPLLNLPNLRRTLEILIHRDCIDFGARRITVSTIGLPEKIIELADFGLQINLAISLHAANDRTRREIVPAARQFKIADILQAAQVYRQKTTRDVTFEYVLLGGVNDSHDDANELADLLEPFKCTVNLIAWNKVEGIGFDSPSRGSVPAFLKTLQNRNISVTVRRSRGRDIDAACGQLYLQENRFSES